MGPLSDLIRTNVKVVRMAHAYSRGQYLFNNAIDTNFISAEAPQNYTWNVIRSESDELIFRHAGRSGAKTFEGVRVTSINFTPVQTSMNSDEITCKRPVSATYEHKANGRLGQISFDYIVDASGRAGILHTKYLKNRNYNKSLRNIAFWGYWTDTGSYGVGTERAYSPFFEALNGRKFLDTPNLPAQS